MERIDPSGPDVRAQVSHAREHEWAATAEDIDHARTTCAVHGRDAVRKRVAALLAGAGAILISAHRGASARLDDNSLEAFAAAIAVGADMIETDVRADDGGNLILAHDRVGERPHSGDARSAGGPGRGPDRDEPRAQTAGLEARLLAALGPRPAGLLVSSFLPEALREVHRLDPSVDTGLVVQIGHDPFAIAGECRATSLVANIEMIDAALLSAAAASQLGLWVWTVNDPVELRRLLAEPAVTGIITDEPELALRLRGGRGARG